MRDIKDRQGEVNLLSFTQLGQDIFLLGPPGPLRRNLIMKYAEMTQRE